jgi:CRP-like cAMP-binding protein
VVKTVLAFLETCPENIRQTFKPVCFQPGEIIMAQGDPPGCVYFLQSGEAKVYHMTKNGISYLEYIYSNGELFGEIEVLNHQPVISDVRASSVCQAVQVSPEAFLAWFKSEPEFALFIAEQVADKLYQACLLAATNIAFPLKYRVLYFLWNETENGKIYLPKEDLITTLGSGERSVNRVLKDLLEMHLIDYDRGLIKVLDKQAVLREMRRYE